MTSQFHFKKRLLPLLFIFSLSLLAVTGCAKPADKEGGKAKGQKVVLNEVAHSIFYAPMYVAIEEGYFKEAGIELELVTGFGAIMIVQKTNLLSHLSCVGKRPLRQFIIS